VAGIDTRRTDRPRPSRQGHTAASRGRTKRSATPLVLLLALAVVLVVAGTVTAVLAMRAPKSSPAAQPAAQEPAVQAAAEPAPSKSAASTATEDPNSAAAATSVPDPSSASKQAVTVLMYHHIMPNPNNSIAISPSTFDAQMKYLKDNGYHPVSIKQFNAFIERGEQLPDKPVLITFDDNRMNQLTYGVPILKKYGFTATFFVVKKWVVANSDSFMREPELKQLAADGFDVESHTASHIQIHPAKLKSTGKVESYESFKSRYWETTEGMRTWMDQTFGGHVSAVAYPGGRYNASAEKLIEEAGYTTAFTTNDGYVTYKGQSAYALPRWNTGAKDTSLSRFAAIVKGANNYKPKKSGN